MLTTRFWFSNNWKRPNEEMADAIKRLAVQCQIGLSAAWKVAHGYRVGRAITLSVINACGPLGIEEAHFIGAPDYDPGGNKRYAAAKKRNTNAALTTNHIPKGKP